MSNPQPPLRLPPNVRDDVAGYRRQCERFAAGEMTPIAFKAYRVPMGVYEQRSDGRYMVRVRLGAGLALPEQLRQVAELSRRYGNGLLHVTTRQDIQIHDVALADTPAVHEGLLEVGLAARGGGGNTVRNVTACPRAGVCPDEVFDVRPYAIATAEYLLSFGDSYNLPRKFKIAYSCSARDCAMAAVADVGYFAQQRDGVAGFRVHAGGGLGGSPRCGVRVEEWIEADRFLIVAQAVKRLFDAHGDRTNKHAARLRYVVERLGEAGFLEAYRQMRCEVEAAGLPGEAPQLRPVWTQAPAGAGGPWPADAALWPEKREGYCTVRLNLPLGDIAAADLEAVADLAATHGEGLVRATQQQELLLAGVPGSRAAEVLAALDARGGDLLGRGRAEIVACAGASTCKLGLCLSRKLAEAIDREFASRGVAAGQVPAIRISGCPNSCGNHHIAAIGLEGRARRVGERLMPYYEVYVDGRLGPDAPRLAQSLGAVPARVVPRMLAEAFGNGGGGAGALERLVADCAQVPADVPEAYFVDWGASEPFSLAGRGPGECSVGVMDVMRVDLDAAQASLKAAQQAEEPARSEATYRAILSAARALLPIYAQEPRKDREVLRVFTDRLVAPGWVSPAAGPLLDAALDWRLGDRESLGDQIGGARVLVDRVTALFASLDGNLQFRLEPVGGDAGSQSAAVDGEQAAGQVADLRGVACPMNFVKAKVALERLAVGEVLEILLDGGDPVKNVPASFAEQGQAVVAVESADGHFRVRVRRER